MKELEKKFKGLIGFKLLYRKKDLIISDVKVKYDKIIVYTDLRTFSLFEQDASELLDELEIKEGSDSVISSCVDTKQLVEYSNNADVITSALMDQLKCISSSDKVSQAQLDKAKAMSQLANTLVNIEKVKLGYLGLK